MPVAPGQGWIAPREYGTSTRAYVGRTTTSNYVSRQNPYTPANVLNEQPALEDIQRTIPGEGEAIPIAYGTAQLGGRIFAVDYNLGVWTIGYVICLGEIAAITNVWINGAAAVSGVLVDTYVGLNNQTANAKLQAAISGYTDTLVIDMPTGTADIGIAYVVVQYNDTHYTSFPTVVAEVQGRKVRDPRKMYGKSVMYGNGTRYLNLANNIVLSNDFDIAFSLIMPATATRLMGASATNRMYVSGSDLALTFNSTASTITGLFTGISAGTHIRIRVWRVGSSVNASINGVEKTAVTNAGAFTINKLYYADASAMPASRAMSLVRIKNSTTKLEWNYPLNEGSGSTALNTHPSTQGATSYTGTWTEATGWTAIAAAPAFSENPALFLGDLITSTAYGLGYTVDDMTLCDIADYNDSLATSEVRRKGYFVMAEPTDTMEQVYLLRSASACFMSIIGNNVFFAPNKVADSVMSITDSLIVQGSIKIRKKDTADLPTVIRAYYTDTTADEWRERLCTPAKAAGVDAGTTPWRESRITLVGCNRHSQAYRECVERLNILTLSDMDVQWEMFDEGFNLVPGDVVSMTTAWGLTNKLLRVDSVVSSSTGRWLLNATEYDPAAYSNTVVSDPTYSDGSLPTQIVPGAPTTPTANEILYQEKNGDWASRLEIAWVAPVGALVTGYYVEVKQGATVVWAVNTTDLKTATGPLKEGVTYDIFVKAYNTLYTSTAASTTETIDGKTTTPNNATNPIGSNNNGEVRLRWTASPDADVYFYRVKYYTTAQTWAAGTLLDEVAALAFSTRVPAPGSTWRFGIKAVDSVGQESAAALEVDVAVALEASGAVTYYSSSNPGAANANDLWINSTTKELSIYIGGTWISARDTAISNVQSIADGKTYTFFQAAEPTGTEGDLWIDTDSVPANKLYRHNGTIWVSAVDAAIATAQATADGKIVTFYQTGDPAGTARPGDLWVDTDSVPANKMYRRNNANNGWDDIQDQAIVEAQSTADEKIVSWYQGTAPTGLTAADVGDLWYDTSNKNFLKRWSGSAWQDADDRRLLALNGSVQNASFTAVAGTRYFIDTSGVSEVVMTLPTSAVKADIIWFADYARTFDYNWFKIARNSHKIMGLEEDLYVDLRNYAGGLEYSDTTQGWIIV